MKRLLALVCAVACGYLIGKQIGSRPSGSDAVVSASGIAERTSDETADTTSSPRFFARVSALDRLRLAEWEELWEMLAMNDSDREAILARLIALDAPGAVDYARTAGESGWMEAILLKWSAGDPIAAYRYRMTMTQFGASFSLQEIPDNALAEAIRRSDGNLIVEILGTNRIGGREVFASLTGGQLRSFLDLLLERKFRSPSIDAAIAALLEKDVDAASKWIAENAKDEGRSEKWTKGLLLAGLGKDFESGITAATAYLEANPGDEEFLGALFRQGGKGDSTRLMDLMEKFGPRDSVGGMYSLARNLLNQVPEDQRAAVEEELVRRGLYTRPGRTVSWPLKSEDDLRAMLTPERRTSERPGERFESNGMLGIPPADAARVIAETDPASVPENIAKSVSYFFAVSDPKGALAWAAGLDDSLSLPAARTVLDTWVAFDANAAKAYAVALPESEFQGAAASAIVRQQVGLDAAATRGWVEGLAAGRFRDAAAEAYVGAAREAEPNSLLPLAMGIADEARRRQALLSLLDRWPEGESSALTGNAVLSFADRDFLLAAGF